MRVRPVLAVTRGGLRSRPFGGRCDVPLACPFSRTPRITGRKKQSELRAALFEVRVHAIVRINSSERRDDILVFTTPPLAEEVEVTGPVVIELYAATDATDTDFTGKLVDVWPDGYAQIILEGVLRARYRESFEQENLVTPGKTEKYLIDLWSTSNLFRRGHRIRVEISSSNFPKYDRNPNTGHAIGHDAERKVAHQTIYHDSEHPSHVLLPVIPAR